jgi:transposase-like protein
MSGHTARQTVKRGMPAIISSCSHQTFYAEYRYNGCKPDVKKAIIKWAADGAGIRATARALGVSTDTVIKEIKKRKADRVCEQKLF